MASSNSTNFDIVGLRFACEQTFEAHLRVLSHDYAFILRKPHLNSDKRPDNLLASTEL